MLGSSSVRLRSSIGVRSPPPPNQDFVVTAVYLTKVESWRVTEDGLIEFTMRRLPTAD